MSRIPTAENPEQADAQDDALLDSLVNRGLERFDSIQIIVTRYNPEDGSTLTRNRGRGCYHSRRSATQQYLRRADEDDRIDMRREYDSDEAS